MYILTDDSAVLKFPYFLEELRSDNPQTSFPLEMSAEELAEWGVFAVEEEMPPAYNEQIESIVIDAPALVKGKWIRGWLVTPASEEEIEHRTLIKTDQVRIERNRYLSNSDFTQLNDYPGSTSKLAQFTQFRQALRDLPAQPGFPWDVIWPLPDSGSI